MKTSIIPIFIPHIGCPYRCVFCNQWKITGQHRVPTATFVKETIQQYMQAATLSRHWEVAFYGGSFTAVPTALQESLLEPATQALRQGKIHGIRCSTRPDAVGKEVIERLLRFGVNTVELGVQSMDDTVLQRAKRGHTATDVVQATRRLHKYGLLVGHQLMPGLPGEDERSLQQTAAAVCALQPDAARIYPVAVLAETELAAQYRQGFYRPLTTAEGIRRGAYLKQRLLEHGIPVIRTGLQATKVLDDGEQVLAGAYTPAMGELIDTYRYRRQLFSLLDRLNLCTSVHIYYAPSETSRVRGYRNITYKYCLWRYRVPFIWQAGKDLPNKRIFVHYGQMVYTIDVDTGGVLITKKEGSYE